MAQQFGREAAISQLSVTVPASTPTEYLRINPLVVPFEGGAAVITGSCTFIPGADITTIDVQIVRNPDAENLTVGEVTIGLTAPSPDLVLVCMGVDQVPSQMDVIYALRITTAGGVADSAATADGVIDATLLSGAKGVFV